MEKQALCTLFAPYSLLVIYSDYNMNDQSQKSKTVGIKKLSMKSGMTEKDL
jgi:hypothetical protein